MPVRVCLTAMAFVLSASAMAQQDEDIGARIKRERAESELASDREKIKMFEGICKLRRADLKAGRKPTRYFEILSLIGREQPSDVNLLKETCKSF